MPDDRISFPLETILGASEREPALTSCPDGHLVVAGRTHWAPRAVSADLGSLICDWVTHEPADA